MKWYVEHIKANKNIFVNQKPVAKGIQVNEPLQSYEIT